MTNDKNAAVVVGVDGSEPSLAALDWAVGEAVARQARLRVVHAFIWPLYRVELGPSPYGPEEGGLRAAAEGMVSGAVRRARVEAPDLQVALLATAAGRYRDGRFDGCLRRQRPGGGRRGSVRRGGREACGQAPRRAGQPAFLSPGSGVDAGRGLRRCTARRGRLTRTWRFHRPAARFGKPPSAASRGLLGRGGPGWPN